MRAISGPPSLTKASEETLERALARPKALAPGLGLNDSPCPSVELIHPAHIAGMLVRAITERFARPWVHSYLLD